jgi:ubiquinone/menaquinone biosynthesis C-methylase UbiE
MMKRLRIFYMRMTGLSIPWKASRTYTAFLYWLWSRIYDLTISWDPAYRANAGRMTQKVVTPGDRVLDVGVGTGLLAEYASKIAGDYVGIDYSGAMLAKAAGKISAMKLQNVSLRWGDAVHLNIEDGTFDAVVSSFMLPHFSKPERAEVIMEMARVLKPSGRIGLFLAQGEVAPLFCLKAELLDYLSSAGFDQIDIEDCDDVYRIITAVKA